MSFKNGDAVRLTASEGELGAGATGVVLQWFPHAEGDLVVVRFGKATRVVHSTSIVELEQGPALAQEPELIAKPTARFNGEQQRRDAEPEAVSVSAGQAGRGRAGTRATPSS